MKVAFIGNSHLAALKRAASVTEFPSSVEVTFFGASAKHTSKNGGMFLEHDGRHLVPRVEEIRETYRLTAGVDRIDTQGFDAFVLVGLTFSYPDFLTLFLNHVRYRHASYVPRAQIFSEDTLEECVKNLIKEDSGLRLSRLFIEADRPVFAIPRPCPSEEILKRKTFKLIRLATDGPYLGLLYDEFCARNERLMKERELLLLPSNTSIHRYPGFNKAEYSTNSRVGWTEGSVAPRKRGDEWHMNELYGQVVLQDFLGSVVRVQ
ncbi:hypothetical protein [Reyranella sp.]|uniref:hypothetical protein n=1 Tax=Reyranella sp. TaxID=1929291 RepID=UPI003D0CEFE0